MGCGMLMVYQYQLQRSHRPSHLQHTLTCALEPCDAWFWSVKACALPFIAMCSPQSRLPTHRCRVLMARCLSWET